ncbi:MAG: TadG family pilus assembly protein [Pirellulaceae bacterium]
MDLCNAELKVATDSAARAAAREYANSGNTTNAINAGISIAAQNNVAGQAMMLSGSDFTFGSALRTSPTQRYTFSTSGSFINAVRVDGSRSGSGSNGSIPLFFGNLVGQTTYDTTCFSTASQTEIGHHVLFWIDRDRWGLRLKQMRRTPTRENCMGRRL